MKNIRQFGFVAFLDLMCCGIGATVLLLLIAVTSVPEHPLAASDETLVVCSELLSGPTAEIGIEYLPPGKTQWERASSLPGKAEFYAVTSGPQSGGDTFFILFAPKSGTWKFRPYLADFPHNRQTDGNLVETNVRLWVYGKHDAVPILGGSDSMLLPGAHGEELAVHVAFSAVK